MKKLYLFVILLFVSKSIIAQRSRWEEPKAVLKQRIADSKEGPAKIRLQLDLARNILYQPGRKQAVIDSAMSYAFIAEQASHQIKFNEGIINAMVLKALCLHEKGKQYLSLQLAKQALAFAQKVKNNNGIAECYLAIGQYYPTTDPVGLESRKIYNDKAIAIFRHERNLRRLASIDLDNAEVCLLTNRKSEALKFAFEALNVAKIQGKKSLQEIFFYIARISNRWSDYPDAIKYNLLAIKTAGAVGDSSMKLCYIYLNTAWVYANMGTYRSAIPYAVMAMQIAKRYKDTGAVREVSLIASLAYSHTNQFSKALPILEESMKWAKNDHDIRETLLSFLVNFDVSKHYPKADFYAIELRRQLAKVSLNNHIDLRECYNYLADHYLDVGQLKIAYYYADRYANIVYHDNYPLGINKVETTYYRLDSIRGDFKSAIQHYLIAQRMKDSIDNTTKAYQISLLQIENETEKKKEDIDNLTRQAQIKDAQLERNHFIQKLIITGSVLLLIITGLIYSRYRLKQRSAALLLVQKSEIDQQNISLQRLVSDKNQLIGEKDELLHEKDLLLKEVNHRVKNNLQIVMSLLASQSGFMQNKKAQEAILESQNRVQAIALIHDTLYNTEKTAEIALPGYITDLIKSLDDSINKGNNKVLIGCDVDDILLDVSQAIPVGIILNEAVTNALKYAFPDERTGEIRVMVNQINGHIEMRISDNGIGLPNGFNLLKANSLGVTLITGLVSQLKGTFDIRHQMGVTITVKFPIETVAMTSIAES